MFALAAGLLRDSNDFPSWPQDIFALLTKTGARRARVYSTCMDPDA